MSCPRGHQVLSFPACSARCQYNVAGNCEFQSCLASMDERSRDDRANAVAKIYGVNPAQVKTEATSVMIAIMVNAFFEYMNEGKPILDCKKSELERLRQSETQFYAWRKGVQRPSFSECMSVLDIIETNL